MSVAGLSMIRDEHDLIGPWLDWTLSQVDHLYVLENGSEDGTAEVLVEYAETRPITVIPDPEVAYLQSEKMSDLAARALGDGHSWGCPIDGDELWMTPDGRPIRDFLAGIGREVAFVEADLFNHLPTSDDPPASCPRCQGGEPFPDDGDGDASGRFAAPCPDCGGLVEPNPFLRIGWRQRERAPLPKVCCKLRPGLVIRQGNHSAWAPGGGLSVAGLVIRHFSWRTADAYVTKIRNGARAYAATDLPDSVGAHWRMFGSPDGPGFDERVAGHFEEWFFVREPRRDDSLIYDPAPIGEKP